MTITPAKFTIQNRLQKGGCFRDILTEEFIKNICLDITGQSQCEIVFNDGLYNQGRMAILEYGGVKSYITFSEQRSNGRNSFFQSVATAIVRYIEDEYENKRIYYYFLPTVRGNYKTNYHLFMYRLISTAGVSFPNADDYLDDNVTSYSTISDIINARLANQRIQNRSTYFTKNEDGDLEIYGKTYGANKKETTLLCLAISAIASKKVTLYQVAEGMLKTLPKPDLDAIRKLGKIEIIIADEQMETREFEENESLRSPSFIFNLFKIRGEKKCTLCDCEIPQLIEGAHIWPVSSIKSEQISRAEKLRQATDGNNGIWLCKNHHRMLDTDLIVFDLNNGQVKLNDLEAANRVFVEQSLKVGELPRSINNEYFSNYLNKRYRKSIY